MRHDAWNKSLILATVVAVGVLVVSIGIEWSLSETLVSQISLVAIALVTAAAAASYMLRAIRLYLLLSQSGVAISLRSTAIAQAVGLALSVTPASVGEIYKLRLIEERSGTPVARTAPVMLLERLLEALGLILFALGAAIAFPSIAMYRPDVRLWLVGIVAAVALWLFRNRLPGFANQLEPLLARLTPDRRLIPAFHEMWQGVRTSFNLRLFIPGLALTVLARLADGLLLLLAAEVLGVQIGLAAALLIVALSGATGAVSLLPGGAGAVETAMAGLLVLVGAPFGLALAIALLARLSSLWLWVIVGLALVFALKLVPAPAFTLKETRE